MWTHKYFGQGYFGQSYFGDGIGSLAPMVVQAVETMGSYAPIQTAIGRAGYAASTPGSYVPDITSGGAP